MIFPLQDLPIGSSGIRRKLSAVFIVWLLAAISATVGLLPAIHVPACALLIAFLACHDAVKPAFLKILAWMAVFLVGIFMALYRPEGFLYFNSISVEQLHEDGKPYQQFINLGKFFGAAIIFSWLMPGNIRTDIRLALGRGNLLIAISCAFVILSAAILLLDLDFISKFSQITIIFLTVNLIVTCFSEETFYRLVVQRPAEKAFTHVITARVFGVFVASAFFTLTHLTDQPDVLVVMIIAGTLYALTYTWTRSLVSAILVHFSVNAIHFMFLPYPI